MYVYVRDGLSWIEIPRPLVADIKAAVLFFALFFPQKWFIPSIDLTLKLLKKKKKNPKVIRCRAQCVLVTIPQCAQTFHRNAHLYLFLFLQCSSRT
ncbi:hypothetical protein FKM82_003625 [Ascaphus truei]